MNALTALAAVRRQAPAPPDRTAAAHGLGYRPDIDGLRAIAVLSVLAYHLDLQWFPGGFVGVDVFFVISGYLISSVILDDLRRGRFSLRRFYVRRVRRIVPALLAMIVVLGGIELVTAFPADLMKFAASALYCTLSISNIYFLNHSNYFDVAAGTQPLLHTWSLAVEEQFYAVFPIIALVLMRWAPRWLVPGIAVIWCGSLALSSHQAFAAPSASFYMADSRAWELLSGTLLATQRAVTARCPGIARNVLAALGLAMIVYAVMAYSEETVFPGLAALLPCVGTVLVIAAGDGGASFAGRLLSVRPVVFPGLISYSLYLWHWPIIYLQQTISILGAGWSWKAEKLLLIVVSFAVATVSWWCVERPFRRRFTAVGEVRVLTAGAAALGVIAVAGVGIILADGLPARFSPQAIRYAGFLDAGQKDYRSGSCFIVPPYGFASFDRRLCLQPDPHRKNYLLLGDSHAAQLYPGLAALLPDTIHLLQATEAGCLPAFSQPIRTVRSCPDLMRYVFNDYLPTTPVDRVLIVARWTDRALPALRRVLAWARARGLKVTLIGPMLEYSAPLPRLLAEASEYDDPRIVADHRATGDVPLDKTLAALAAEFDDRYVSILDLLCQGGGCTSLADDGSPLEFDTDHLTAGGSATLVRRMIAAGDLP